MIKIYGLATSHNRYEKTLKSIESLFSQNGINKSFSLRLIIVDDGSIDGTADCICKRFPDVQVLRGNGNLFWAGGMRCAYNAIPGEVDYDFLFVFNDDVEFEKNAISILLDAMESKNYQNKSDAGVLTGDFYSNDGIQTYGGLVRNSKFNPISFTLDKRNSAYVYQVDTVNMNGCLVRKMVVDRLGFLGSYFIHGGADIEFGLRVNRSSNYSTYRVNRKIGVCDRNNDRFLEGNLIARLRTLMGPKYQPFKQRLIFHWQYGGVFWPFFFILYYLKAAFPRRNV